MTLDKLIDEGRRLQKKTVLLSPAGSGDVAGIWYGHDHPSDSDELFRPWIAVNTTFIPEFGVHGWLSVMIGRTSRGGRVEVNTSISKKSGLRLYASEISVLPPIDAVIAFGSETVGEWLSANNWRRDWRYNNNFRDRKIVEEYEAVERRAHPLYEATAYATLGGWHYSWPDGDWDKLHGAKLLAMTYMDSEPWVESWQLPSGEFKVIQRIT